ncbi:MAG: hypothetical protein FWC27_13540 [Firmicutes bacterium]|nr:hypothetical protein [Bacillota bacterium]
MKKALSALLVAAVVLGLAAPLAFAIPNTGSVEEGQLTPASYTLYMEPANTTQKSEINVNLPAAPTPRHTGCAADCLIYWDIVAALGDNIVGYRPEDYDPDLGALRPGGTVFDIETLQTQTTLGSAMSMTLFAREEGTETIYAECQECNTYWTIVVTVVPPEEEEEGGGEGLLEILKSWWFDLKWTWDYQIKPFFKYIYFNAGNWFCNAWDLLINSICNLFDGLFSKL